MEYVVGDDGAPVRADGSGRICCARPAFVVETEGVDVGDRPPHGPDLSITVSTLSCARCGWELPTTTRQRKGEEMEVSCAENKGRA